MGISVDRIGTFRCRLVEKGISKTKEKGYPQLIAKVLLTQLYDEKGGENGEGVWFPIEDWGMEAMAYACLYGVSKKSGQVEPTLSYDQAVKVFKWDGASMSELDQTDHTGLEFQVRITENTYEGARSPFQVSWIDEYDADPVYTLRKLDAKEIKDLDAQFSAGKVASAKKAASAPKAPHPARVPADDGKKSQAPVAPKVPVKPKAPVAETEPAKMTKAEKNAALKKKSDRIKAEAAKQKTPTASKSTTPPPPDDEDIETAEGTPPAVPEAGGSCTKQEAWEKIFEMRDPSIDDETVKDLWKAAIEEVAGPGVATADVAPEQWWQIKDIVVADCGKF